MPTPTLPLTASPVFGNVDALDLCTLKSFLVQEIRPASVVEVLVGQRWVKAVTLPYPKPFGLAESPMPPTARIPDTEKQEHYLTRQCERADG